EPSRRFFSDRPVPEPEQRPVPGIAQKPRPGLLRRRGPSSDIACDQRLRPHRGAVGEVAQLMTPQEQALGLEPRNVVDLCHGDTTGNSGRGERVSTKEPPETLYPMPAHFEIRADFDARSIVVYQAFSSAIALPALEAQRLVPPFSFQRMTWIKPSFLWLMER